MQYRPETSLLGPVILLFCGCSEPTAFSPSQDAAFGFSGGIGDAHWDRRTIRVFRDDPEGPSFQRGPATARMQLAVENPTTGELLVTQVEEVLAIR